MSWLSKNGLHSQKQLVLQLVFAVYSTIQKGKGHRGPLHSAPVPSVLSDRIDGEYYLGQGSVKSSTFKMKYVKISSNIIFVLAVLVLFAQNWKVMNDSGNEHSFSTFSEHFWASIGLKKVHSRNQPSGFWSSLTGGRDLRFSAPSSRTHLECSTLTNRCIVSVLSKEWKLTFIWNVPSIYSDRSFVANFPIITLITPSMQRLEILLFSLVPRAKLGISAKTNRSTVRDQTYTPTCVVSFPFI